MDDTTEAERSAVDIGGEEPNPADRGDATKSPDTILRQEIEVGKAQINRPAKGLLLSAISAGLDIGFGPFLVATVLALSSTETLGSRLVVALVYSIGFAIVILGRSELFTEHTTLAVLPVLSGRASLPRLLRLWGIVYAGNIVGAAAFAGLATPLGRSLGLFEPADLAEMADHLTDHGWLVILGSGIAAGWLMGLVSWLVTAARDTVGQLTVIVLVAGSIAFLGLHHSIAGSVEVLMGVFGGVSEPVDYLRFLLWATVGNAVGGTLLVAGLKYSHVTDGQPTQVG